MNLFFDLDGTLIDVSEKYYRIYSEFLKESGLASISKEKFWRFKRRKIPIRDLLDSDTLYNRYKRFFIERIEHPDYLLLDQIFPFSQQVLNTLKEKGNALYLLTLRRHSSAMFQQLEQFQFTQFQEILTMAPPPFQSEDNYQCKIALLENKVSPHSLIIGDSQADILCGRHFQIRTLAVLTGISGYEYLRKLSPSHIGRDIRAALSM